MRAKYLTKSRRLFREPGTAAMEALAVSQNADVYSLFVSEPIVENYEVNGACVVTIRGPIEHHECGYGESYEGIRCRFGEALASDSPAIILRIDSPGGVVSGLNQAVYDMRRAKNAIGKPVYVYVDEMACSAAYAISCVGDEIIIPPSGIAGSVGVISLMYDQTGLDKKSGLNFETITSGTRKADGHPHVELSSDAVDAEKGRVDDLAGQFFRIVAKSRGLSVDDVQSYQAAIYMGSDAVDVGLADDVMGWEALLGVIAATHGIPTKKQPVKPKMVAQSNNRVLRKAVAQNGTQQEPGMLRLKSAIARTQKALVAEGDEKKRRALAAQLAGYESALATIGALKKTKIKYSEESEESGEEDDEEEESEESGNETDREEDDMPGDKKKPMKDDDSDDDDGDDDSEEDDEEEEEESEGGDAEAIAALRKMASKAGGKVSAALANLLTEREANKKLAGRIAAIEKRNANSEKSQRIEAHLVDRKITRAEASELKNKTLAFVKDYLGMRKRAIVRSPSERLTPDLKFSGDVENGYGDLDGASATFSAEDTVQNEKFIADIASRTGKSIEDTRKQLMGDYKKRLSALNGAPKGRF